MKILQHSLKGPQTERGPVGAMPSDLGDTSNEESREPPNTPAGPAEMPTEALETSGEEDEQIRTLRDHLEKLAAEKAGLQAEVDALRGRMVQISEQLAMLMETIQAKDRVIMQLSQQGGASMAQELQELDRLRVGDAGSLAKRQLHL